MSDKDAPDSFAVWFEAQHMHRMATGMHNHSDDQLRAIAADGRAAANVLACRELWDDKRQAALYAWNAGQAVR